MTSEGVRRGLDSSHSVAAFPLGGIGTGNVSLSSTGALRDWEIFNTPAKNGLLPNSFFAIRVQAPDQAPIARVLEGRVHPPHASSHGYNPITNKGLPRFAHSRFHGEYPIAYLQLVDPKVPVTVSLEAFTPLVPLNPEDSGIPCAIFTYTVTNTISQPVDVTVVGSLVNPCAGLNLDGPLSNLGDLAFGRTCNRIREEDGFNGLYLYAEGISEEDFGYGTMSLVTDHERVTVKTNWLRGDWWDYLQDFWDDFVEDGLLDNYDYAEDSSGKKPDTASLGLLTTLAPGEAKTFRFILTWHFPNRPHTWRTSFTQHKYVNDGSRRIIRNHYATRFSDAWSVARYVMHEYERLATATRLFHDALFDSSLPSYVIDAISANIVPVRSTTCFWFEDGRFYGWEGSFDDQGSCPGSCTHVWSYAYTVAYLFPSLEREMRRIEFEVETDESGFMHFRNLKSMGDRYIYPRDDIDSGAASDGQMGSILRCWREWRLSGDRAWLERVWPGIQRSIAFASRVWDNDQDGVLDGKQHNTYDIQFYGPNPLSGIYYLAALRAVEELARVMGDDALAVRCRATFEHGSARLSDLLWNGDYFVQRLDDLNAYKYQHGTGCLSDQLLGQVHATVLGLGDLLPRDQLHRAIKSVFENNFCTDFSEHANCQRTYALNDEAGLVMCTWPKGGRPRLPFVYSDEVWTGVEYHVAANLIAEGWLDEGLAVVKAVRDRHDGLRRNPWNEVECGNHYARSMASWLLLLTLTGVQVNVADGVMTFAPHLEASTNENCFRALWSSGQAWGTFRQFRDHSGADWQYAVTVLGGNTTGLSITAAGQPVQVAHVQPPFTVQDVQI